MGKANQSNVSITPPPEGIGHKLPVLFPFDFRWALGPNPFNGGGHTRRNRTATSMLPTRLLHVQSVYPTQCMHACNTNTGADAWQAACHA